MRPWAAGRPAAAVEGFRSVCAGRRRTRGAASENLIRSARLAGRVTRRAFSVSIFAIHDGEVLLVRHKRLALWLPVGGEVEANETPLEAARRELHEETGLDGDFHVPNRIAVPGAPPGLLGYEEHPAGSKGLHLNFMFAARVPHRRIASDESYDAHAWFREAPTESPENVRVGLRLALEAAAGRA